MDLTKLDALNITWSPAEDYKWYTNGFYEKILVM